MDSRQCGRTATLWNIPTGRGISFKWDRWRCPVDKLRTGCQCHHRLHHHLYHLHHHHLHLHNPHPRRQHHRRRHHPSRRMSRRMKEAHLPNVRPIVRIAVAAGHRLNEKIDQMNQNPSVLFLHSSLPQSTHPFGLVPFYLPFPLCPLLPWRPNNPTTRPFPFPSRPLMQPRMNFGSSTNAA